ncbi:hypothetical protein SteCoe_23873 [Stentor coeruleus]|uniref:Uncharacterized protein n=1 Tax=Stentor coeruleus TaxID=5963 RepID=A0A1R2BIV8_9CILI|nr:hypothetical protein SteCoe_23873 [Stentor coeruleus]
MNILTVINEELEEELPDDCSEIVQKLMRELKIALKRAEESEEQLQDKESTDIRVKELTALCHSKSAEIFALERKVKDLTAMLEEKDKQMISILSLDKEFKQLVKNQDKGIQTDPGHYPEIERRLIQSEEKNIKLKEMFISQIEEIQKLKSVDSDIRENGYGMNNKRNIVKGFLDSEREKDLENTKKKVDAKVKPGGYYPMFLRKPKMDF